MTDTIDARGLSCPQPVILLRAKIKEIEKGTITILVDNETAKENVIRAAENRGWTVDKIEMVDEDYQITLKK